MAGVDYRAAAVLMSVLRTQVRTVAVERADGIARPRVRIDHPQAARTLLTPVWAGEGYPQDVQQAISSDSWSNIDREHETPVVVARRISPGARALLEAEGASWADEQGRASIHADGLLIVIEDAPTPVPAGDAAFRWNKTSGAIAELVLSQYESGHPTAPLPPVQEIASTIGISPALASRALRGFDAQGWTRKSGAERGSSAVRSTSDPTGLLSAWAGWHGATRPVVVHAHATTSNLDQFLEEQIAALWPQGTWALTGWMALERRAPFMTSVPTISLYLERDIFDDTRALEGLLARSGLRRVDRGARVEIYRADPRLPLQSGAGAPTPQVHDVRLYGDLLHFGVRGADAAEHLRETRIGF